MRNRLCEKTAHTAHTPSMEYRGPWHTSQVRVVPGLSFFREPQKTVLASITRFDSSTRSLTALIWRLPGFLRAHPKGTGRPRYDSGDLLKPCLRVSRLLRHRGRGVARPLDVVIVRRPVLYTHRRLPVVLLLNYEWRVCYWWRQLGTSGCVNVEGMRPTETAPATRVPDVVSRPAFRTLTPGIRLAWPSLISLSRVEARHSMRDQTLDTYFFGSTNAGRE